MYQKMYRWHETRVRHSLIFMVGKRATQIASKNTAVRVISLQSPSTPPPFFIVRSGTSSFGLSLDTCHSKSQTSQSTGAPGPQGRARKTGRQPAPSLCASVRPPEIVAAHFGGRRLTLTSAERAGRAKTIRAGSAGVAIERP